MMMEKLPNKRSTLIFFRRHKFSVKRVTFWLFLICMVVSQIQIQISIWINTRVWFLSLGVVPCKSAAPVMIYHLIESIPCSVLQLPTLFPFCQCLGWLQLVVQHALNKEILPSYVLGLAAVLVSCPTRLSSSWRWRPQIALIENNTN